MSGMAVSRRHDYRAKLLQLLQLSQSVLGETRKRNGVAFAKHKIR